MPVSILLQGQSITREKKPSELSSVFQGLLENIKVPNTDNQLQQNPKKLLENLLDRLPKEVEEQLVQLLKDTKKVDEAVETLNLDTETMQQLKDLLNKIAQPITNNLLQILKPVVTPTINTTVVPINKKEIKQQLVDISKNAELLLSSGKTDQKSIAKLAPEILKLLEQWNSLEKKLTGTKEEAIPFGKLDTSKSSKAETAWQKLVSTYQKRDQLVTSHHYNSNAKVTSSDVEKWIGKALAKDVQDKVPLSQVGSSTTLQQSKVEQFVIHVNQTKSTQNAGQQLVDKFQEVMNTSKFLTINNGTTQLSISLRPANLGEMMVKLTQVNGEMVVKIIVASAAAKDMLETNMHQLKHMFSPQQVMIEKQDVTEQEQNVQQENEQQSANNNDQNQSEDPNQDEQEQKNDKFDKQFHEILMNEKV